MSGSTIKNKKFVEEPMKNKPVTDLPGIGKILGKRLAEAGFDKAHKLLAQYLLLNKDKKLFEEWVKDKCHANSAQASHCYNCLNEWCKEFL